LKSRRDQLLVDGCDSDDADAVYRHVKAMHIERLKLDAQKERQQELFKRLSDAKSELDALEQTVAIQSHNIDVEISEQISQLALKHESEIEDLARQWESEPKIRLYNRPSGFLRSLRVQANVLFDDHQYEALDSVTKQADIVEAKEVTENRRKQQQEYEDLLLVMQRHHTAERKELERMHEQKRAEHRAAEAFDARVIKNRIHNLKIELEAAADPEKLWNLRHRFDAKALGKRPKLAMGRATGRRAFRIEDHNVLNLPPLADVPPVRREGRTRPRHRFSHAIQAPKYSWL
jgi:hypothetical protein